MSPMRCRPLLLPAFTLLAVSGGTSTLMAQCEPLPLIGDRTLAYQEAERPQVHFTSRVNWLNDPNGLVYFAGEYHLFFQHNPYGIEWGNMTWGHAVSPDLVHWTQLGHAIWPDAQGTMYSGSAVVDWENTSGFAATAKGQPDRTKDTDDARQPPLVLMYTAAGSKSKESAGRPFTQCIAYSNDKGRTWTKYARNPVIGHIAAENRDPKVIWHPGTKRWIVALYEDGSRYSLHASPNLKEWKKLQDLEMPGCSECPDFFPMAIDGDATKQKWVFTAADSRYMVGTFDGTRFTPEPVGKAGIKQVDFGRNFYAVQSYSDIPPADGRRIQIAWMRGPHSAGMPFNQQMSFPTEVKLKTTADGPRLFRLPVKEIEKLHGPEVSVSGVKIGPGETGVDAVLKGLTGGLFHIRLEVKPELANEVGLVVMGETIRYTTGDGALHALGDAALELENGTLRLELLVDRTSIETFGNDGRVAMASCFEPKAQGAQVQVFAKGGTATVVSMTVWPLKSAWEQPSRVVSLP